MQPRAVTMAMRKLFGSPTGIYAGAGIILAGEITLRTKHIKKVKNLSKEAKKALKSYILLLGGCMRKLLLANTVVLPDQLLMPGAVLIEDNVIVKVGNMLDEVVDEVGESFTQQLYEQMKRNYNID